MFKQSIVIFKKEKFMSHTKIGNKIKHLYYKATGDKTRSMMCAFKEKTLQNKKNNLTFINKNQNNHA